MHLSETGDLRIFNSIGTQTDCVQHSQSAGFACPVRVAVHVCHPISNMAKPEGP